jgi:hypothetical protein
LPAELSEPHQQGTALLPGGTAGKGCCSAQRCSAKALSYGAVEAEAPGSARRLPCVRGLRGRGQAGASDRRAPPAEAEDRSRVLFDTARQPLPPLPLGPHAARRMRPTHPPFSERMTDMFLPLRTTNVLLFFHARRASRPALVKMTSEPTRTCDKRLRAGGSLRPTLN